MALEKQQGSETRKPNKVPLAEAAETFAIVCNAIDEGNLDETIVAIFNQTRLDLATAVDRRVCFLNFCTSSMQAAKETRNAWAERARQLEALEERIKVLTIDQIKSSGLEQAKGDLGRLCIQNNPEALSLDFDLHDMMVNRVIDPIFIEVNAVPDKYLKKIAAYQLDTKQIKEDLQAGETLPWAKLTRGQHLRIRM